MFVSAGGRQSPETFKSELEVGNCLVIRVTDMCNNVGLAIAWQVAWDLENLT